MHVSVGRLGLPAGWWQWWRGHHCTAQTCQPCWRSPLHVTQCLRFAVDDAWSEPAAAAAAAAVTFVDASAAAVELRAAAGAAAVAAVVAAAVVARTAGVGVEPLPLEAADTAVAVGQLE